MSWAIDVGVMSILSLVLYGRRVDSDTSPLLLGRSVDLAVLIVRSKFYILNLDYFSPKGIWLMLRSV